MTTKFDDTHLTIEPYEHDCDKCEWLGWITRGPEPPANVYLHRHASGAISVIIRYSSEGPDYWSITTNSMGKAGLAYGYMPDLYHKHKRAIEERERSYDLEEEDF